MAHEMLGKRPISPDGTPVPYSPMIRAGAFIFISGQLPFDAQRRIVPGGIEEHTRQSLANILALLEQAGCGLSDIVKTTNYLADARDFQAFNRAYQAFFPTYVPARSTVCTQLLVPEARVEIEAIACRSP